jgi:OPT family oligopeptide transporter
MHIYANCGALHEKEKRKKGERTRLQFFAIVFVASFAYYIVPGHFFPSLSALSFVCWIWKRSITAQQIGAGLNGLGIGSFGLDWATVASFLGTPLAYPFFAIVNTMVGFILVMYVLVPIAYWSNFREAKRFPIFTSHTFDEDGQIFNITRVLNEKTFDLNLAEYENYSKLYLSIFFAFLYGLSFASLTATLTHVALFDGKYAIFLNINFI